ncbi:MAG: NAD(P)H-binding protein [Agriterribacter sp.]
MYPKTALLLGATGLIGNHLLQLLLNDDEYGKIIALTRKPLPVAHTRLENRIVDFSDTENYRQAITEGDIVFCCIGTTMKDVKGNKTLYRQIDFDIPVNGARFALAKGYTQYALVSAIGARSASSNFYLSLKGQTEDAISPMEFSAVHIFRPSLLLGKRAASRTGEKIAQAVMPALSFLLAGSLAKYKPVAATEVASAMIAATKTGNRGVNIYTYNEIKSLLKGR